MAEVIFISSLRNGFIRSTEMSRLMSPSPPPQDKRQKSCIFLSYFLPQISSKIKFAPNTFILNKLNSIVLKKPFKWSLNSKGCIPDTFTCKQTSETHPSSFSHRFYVTKQEAGHFCFSIEPSLLAEWNGHSMLNHWWNLCTTLNCISKTHWLMEWWIK